jgi:hypothetical protein
LYFKTSLHFKRQLGRALYNRRLHVVEQWWHTANAAILPYLISTVDQPNYEVVDRLVRWALENCANNYAKFSKDFKTLKKQMRKHFAIEGSLDTFYGSSTMLSYTKACKIKQDFDGPASYGRYVLLWTQTRATGLANSEMIRESINKFVGTIEEPSVGIPINPAVLLETLSGARDAKASMAVVSIGTTACLEKTRESGGKTAQLKELSRKKVLRHQYNWETLEETSIAPRAVRNSRDIVDWAIQSALHRPTHTRCVRVHAVAEPGKARTITVAPYGYQVLMGVYSHVYQATLKSKGVQSGLRADRHLWRFLQQNLNPQSENWEKLDEGQVFSLSTDLSEATDFGNKEFAKRVLDYMIRMTPGMPLGLSVLVKTLYCSKRFVFAPWCGGYSLHVATRSWFMGDMMTKFMLTAAHDYCCRLSGLQVYTLVGDDEIALSSDPDVLYRHLDTLKTLFRVSEDDTFVSGHFAFYCEEGTLLPQRVSELNHVRMRRGQELLYLDYPRIRLLLPIRVETDAYSSTNQGRFALLGKEARWVDSVNQEAKRHFTVASLYQHLLLRQDTDTLCPFTPLEMGGDGGFPHSGSFLRRVVDDKARDPRETKFRMSSLLNNAFSHKFVRSDRLDKVVHKHHLYLPKLEGLKAILPEDSILEPKTEEATIMLRSMRFRDIEKPQSTFLRLCRGLYYQSILQGKDPVEPVFGIDRSYSRGHTADPDVDFHSFIEKWKNPGFNYQDIDSYFVRKSMVPGLNPMNLGLKDESPDKYPSSRELFNDWAERNIPFEETSLPAILAMIKDKDPLPPRVVQRLNLFLESDAYILHMLPTKPQKVVGLVTRDIKLGVKVLYAINGREPEVYHYVVCLDPAIYMVGRTEEVSGILLDLRQRVPEDIEWITDPGSMLHVDYNEFTDGFPHREDIWDANIRILETRTEYVYRAVL